MTFTVIDAEQRSPQWFAARAGRVTSSAADAMLSKGRKPGEESVGRRNLRVRLALERITGRSLERDFSTQAMRDGVDREADAYAAYEAQTGTLLTRTGFLSCHGLMAGTSLDGHVGAYEGIVEIKAPTPAIHLEYCQSGEIPLDYLRQVMHALFVTGAQWADWMSYSPDFPEGLQTKIVRVKRADVDLVAYELALTLFLTEVDRTVAEIRALAERQAS